MQAHPKRDLATWPCDINGLTAVVRTRLKRKQQQTRCE
jgi:hypothetical protein